MSGLAALIRSSAASVELLDGDNPSAASVPVAGWEDRGGALVTSVTFGPYSQRVTADGVRVSFNGEAELIELPRLSIPPGVAFTYNLTIGVTRVDS